MSKHRLISLARTTAILCSKCVSALYQRANAGTLVANVYPRAVPNAESSRSFDAAASYFGDQRIRLIPITGKMASFK
jgi:hypothetical protein